MRIEEANEVINEILDNFDFEKVHAVMVLTGWTWYETHVPAIEEMRECARHHLLHVCVDEAAESTRGSGGFTAYKCRGEVQLIFELESYVWNN